MAAAPGAVAAQAPGDVTLSFSCQLDYLNVFSRGKFYFALYEFVPEDNEGSMVGVARGQVVRVIASSGAGEWWYVETRTSVRGYVPASYLKPYYESH